MTRNELIFWSSWFGVLSLVTIVVYGLDKRRARREGQRVPERKLHILALLGGWPGAMLAQWLFRHKSWKRKFRVVFWLTVLGNLAAVVTLFAAFKQFAQWFS